MDDFEWDEAKARLNREKHGIGFNDASQALVDLPLTRSSSRGAERRFSSMCNSGGLIIVVIWTPRKDVIRLISARLARKSEREQYRQAVAKAAQAR